MHINPDHFLQTPAGRVTSHERNNDAWTQSYRAFHQALASAGPGAEVCVLVGPQGAGKSTWARERVRTAPQAIVFDAILVRHRERCPIVAAAQAAGVPCVAVWFRTPLEQCLARNRQRPADEVVDEQALRNVHAAVEPPRLAEGFARVIEVQAADDAGA